MAPRKVDKDAKKLEILEASIRVFSRQGVGGTKMADIAAEAKIGKGTIYEYFKSKDEIFSTSFDLFIEQLSAESAKLMFSSKKASEKLADLFHSLYKMIDDNFEIMNIMIQYWADGIINNNSNIDMKNMYGAMRRQVEMILQEGIDQGEFTEHNTGAIASSIIGGMDGLMLQWMFDKEAFALESAVHELYRIIIKGLKH